MHTQIRHACCFQNFHRMSYQQGNFKVVQSVYPKFLGRSVSVISGISEKRLQGFSKIKRHWGARTCASMQGSWSSHQVPGEQKGKGTEAPTWSCPAALQPEPELSVPEKQKQPVLRILQSREERRHGQLWTGYEAFCLTDPPK